MNLIVLHFDGNSTNIHYSAENWVFEEKISIKMLMDNWLISNNHWWSITGVWAICLRSNTKNTRIWYMHRRPCLLCIRCQSRMYMFGNLKSLNGRKHAYVEQKKAHMQSTDCIKIFILIEGCCFLSGREYYIWTKYHALHKTERGPIGIKSLCSGHIEWVSLSLVNFKFCAICYFFDWLLN